MNPLTLVALLLLAGAPLPAAGRPSPELVDNLDGPDDTSNTVSLQPGQKTTLSLAGVDRCVVGDDEVAAAQLVDGKLVLTAGQIGRTTLIVWTAKGKRSYLVVVKKRKAGKPSASKKHVPERDGDSAMHTLD